MPVRPTVLILSKGYELPDGPIGPMTLTRVFEEMVFLVGQAGNALPTFGLVMLDGGPGTYPFRLDWHQPSGEVHSRTGLVMNPADPGPIQRVALEGLVLPCPENGLYYLELTMESGSVRSQTVQVRRNLSVSPPARTVQAEN